MSDIKIILICSCFLIISKIRGHTLLNEDEGKVYLKTQDTYIAAVYEHRPTNLSIEGTSMISIDRGLNTYASVVEDAAKQGADIVVFPEDGLMAFGGNRDSEYPFLEDIPETWANYNPCEIGRKSQRYVIQYRLSCLAREFHMYIVANFGTIKLCNATEPCTPDGRFQYNTNVVFDNQGTIVSLYHKWNLFYESAFDFPPQPEYAIFTTPFGTFATMVCFDILFKEPAVDLVEKYGVRNIILPTAWGSILPEMSGIGYHESWAKRMGVNLLTSELHVPYGGFVGSLIASGSNGAIAYSNEYVPLSPTSLLVANISSNPKLCQTSIVTMNQTQSINSNTFNAYMQGNLFTFIFLEKPIGQLLLRSSNVRCQLDYVFKTRTFGEKYALGVFKGLHTSSMNSSIEVCALVKCLGLYPETCGMETRKSSTVFSYLNLRGEFSGNYIFPSVLTDEGGLSKEWNFTLDTHNSRGEINVFVNDSLLSAILLARNYEKDNNIPTPYYHSPRMVDIEDINMNETYIDDVSDHDRNNLNIILPSVIFVVALVGVSIFVIHLWKKTRRSKGYRYEQL